MSMFTNYDLTPTNYIPDNRCYKKCVPELPKMPLINYNGFGKPVGYTWNQGDTICLEFITTGNVVYDPEDLPNNNTQGIAEDAEVYLQGKKFQILIYDFRYNVVAQCEVPAFPNVKILSSDLNTDGKSLVKGTYNLKLTLIDENENTIATLIEGEDCMIYIK